MQKLNEGESFTVATAVYGMKVGSDIRMFATGRYDWNAFVTAVARAFVQMIQEELYSEFMNAASKLPVTTGFVGNGALTSSTKDAFDAIISNVETVNGVQAVILGTKTALKKLNGLAGAGSGSSVDWISNGQKEAVAETGILGSYEGTPMIEIPQRFKFNQPGQRMVKDDVLLIFPVVDYKPIKFVDYGLKEFEITEVGDTMNDLQSFEAQRRMGVATIITRYFGQWNL